MKKLYKNTISIALVIAILLPLVTISVSAMENTGSADLPPWVEDGEVWHPANGIMLFEDFGNCPENHRPPAGYTYQGYTEGNTLFDIFVTSQLVNLVAWVPGLGTIAKIIDDASTLEWLVTSAMAGHLKTTYFKYVYTYGNLYWYHYSWFYRDENGGPRYITCEVQKNA